MLYEVLLPHLAGSTLQACRASKHDTTRSRDSSDIPFATPQRSGTCHFRCVWTAFKYLLRSVVGLSSAAVKQLCLAVRIEWLAHAHANLVALHRPLAPFEGTVLEVACRQCARAALKESHRGSLAPAQASALLALLQNLRARVALAASGDAPAVDQRVVVRLRLGYSHQAQATATAAAAGAAPPCVTSRVRAWTGFGLMFPRRDVSRFVMKRQISAPQVTHARCFIKPAQPHVIPHMVLTCMCIILPYSLFRCL